MGVSQIIHDNVEWHVWKHRLNLVRLKCIQRKYITKTLDLQLRKPERETPEYSKRTGDPRLPRMLAGSLNL